MHIPPITQLKGDVMAKSEPRQWKPVFPPGAEGPVGNYSPAIIAGDLVFTSGQIPQDPATGQIEGDRPVEEQALRVLDNLRTAIEASGGVLADMISVTVYLADVDDWATFNRVFGEYFDAPYPTRTVVGANLEGFRVEASAIALKRHTER
jgi:2-iminobutanoate/2-iminopropanoate deaminase